MKKILTFIVLALTSLFLVSCKNKKTDDFEKVFNEINIGYEIGDSSASVTKNIKLPTTTTVAGATINWLSVSDYVTSTGIVTRPTGQNATAVLVLQVTINGVTKDKNFYLTIVALGKEEQVTYTVTFNSDGGTSVLNQTIGQGELAISPSNVFKDGFYLEGWYKDINLTQKWNFSVDVVTSNITLYANWKLANENIPAGFIPINTKDDFLNISDYSKKYILTNDIDFSGSELKPLGGWDGVAPFSGEFNGNGYALMNFTINGSNHNLLKDKDGNSFGASVFPHLTGVVRNLNIINANITGSGFSAGIAGLNDGLIENVYFEGKVTSSKSWGSVDSWAVPAGGIAGIQGGSGSVSNVFIDAHITGGHIFFGYAFKAASNLIAVKETLDVDMILHTGQEKDGETDYLVKSFTNAHVLTKNELIGLNFGLKWSSEGANRPYLTRTDGIVPSWAKK